MMFEASSCAGCDVLVVGAGLSGLETACALRAAGADVLVLGGGIAGRALWSSALPGHYEAAASCRGVGGRSRYWHGVVLRLEEWALRDPVWPSSAVCDLVGTQGRRGLYEQVEAELAAWAGASLDATRGDADETLAAVLGAVLARELRIVPRAVRAAPAGSPAYTPLERWHRLEGSERLLADKEALALVVERGRVVGVQAYDCRSRLESVISCTHVVLAAGVLENTRLVAQLHDPGERYAGLADHLVQGFLVVLPEAAFGLRAPAEGLVYAAGDAASRSNLFARLRPATGEGRRLLLDVWAMGEQLPGRASSVVAEQAQRLPWAMKVEPGLSPVDRALLAAQRRELGDAWRRLAAAIGVPPLPFEFPDFLVARRSFSALQAVEQRLPVGQPVAYTWPLGSVDHETGTLPLGSPCVDDVGKVRAVEGVYVTGPATFARPGAANPSLTTFALARRTARALADAG